MPFAGDSFPPFFFGFLTTEVRHLFPLSEKRLSLLSPLDGTSCPKEVYVLFLCQVDTLSHSLEKPQYSSLANFYFYTSGMGSRFPPFLRKAFPMTA